MFLHIFFTLFVSIFFQNPRFDSNETFVRFSMKHKLHSWDGMSKEIKVATKWDSQKKEINQISIVVNVSTFNSGISNRDSHMLEVLDVLSYPRIVFNSSKIEYTPEGVVVKGKLQFHGIDKMIETKVKHVKSNSKWIFTGSIPVYLEDHKIERPSLLFVKVDNLVKVDFQFTYSE
jgi:polyisoprenoid-binding protein YceI